VSGEYCTYNPYTGYTSTVYCGWGCCYSYIYPCCDTPFYGDTPFIAGTCTAGAFVIIAAIAAICIRNRRRIQTTVQYTNPGGQQVFSTSMNTNVSTGYSAPVSGFANNGYRAY
ncbi:unnamed protein product, partial [Lymnaea stagnalis]